MKKGGLDLKGRNELRRLMEQGYNVAEVSDFLRVSEETVESFAKHFGFIVELPDDEDDED